MLNGINGRFDGRKISGNVSYILLFGGIWWRETRAVIGRHGTRRHRPTRGRRVQAHRRRPLASVSTVVPSSTDYITSYSTVFANAVNPFETDHRRHFDARRPSPSSTRRSRPHSGPRPCRLAPTGLSSKWGNLQILR